MLLSFMAMPTNYGGGLGNSHLNGNLQAAPNCFERFKEKNQLHSAQSSSLVT